MPIPPRKRIRPESVNMTPIYLTPQGIERLREKLARMKRALPALAEEAARTAAYGDRSDNAEYKQAKGALRYTNHQVFLIEDQLKRVVPIMPGRNSEGTIQRGSVVTLRESTATGASEKTFEILGATETDPGKGRISDLSPLGAALIGHKEGDVVTLETANGKREYKVVRVG